MQLTTFCLSALSILKGSPRYKLKFIDQWSNERKLTNYLISNGCLSGIPGSGNFAMFVAIFLTHVYNSTDDKKYYYLIEKWFELHNKSQNSFDGFWGTNSIENPYIRFQNGFHQFIIYEYWQKQINYSKLIIDNLIKVVDNDGHFAPWPGGGGCYDYDAVHMLIKLGIEKNYKVELISKILSKNLQAQLNSQNDDHGFCESKKRPENIFNSFKIDNILFYLNAKSINILYQRLRHTLSISRTSHQLMNNHWSQVGHSWDKSNMWNTWFRSLAIAEIITALKLENQNFNFQKHIGLGYYIKDHN